MIPIFVSRVKKWEAQGQTRDETSMEGGQTKNKLKFRAPTGGVGTMIEEI